MHMLNIEICIDKDDNIEIEPGTYQLNTSIGSSIAICEYELPGNGHYKFPDDEKDQNKARKECTKHLINNNKDNILNRSSNSSNFSSKSCCVHCNESFGKSQISKKLFSNEKTTVESYLQNENNEVKSFYDLNTTNSQLNSSTFKDINLNFKLISGNESNFTLNDCIHASKSIKDGIKKHCSESFKEMQDSDLETMFDSKNEQFKFQTYAFNSTIFDGYITVSDKSDIQIFKYKTLDKISKKENYIEEYFPCKKYINHYKSVIGDENEKNYIMKCIERIMSVRNSTINLFGLNKCILIYGEPGVGKSTFSKALVQKLSIRMNQQYILRTVHCSTLFSKFYGESMKILNETVNGSIKNTIFLFDEADSILMDRKLILQRNEPGDSLRMVNMLLNVLDRKENLFIFTSNFKDELDSAFLSRCDICYEMRKLSVENTYKLMKLSIESLFETEYNLTARFLDFSSIRICKEACDVSRELYELAFKYNKISPREIKKRIVLLSNKNMKSIMELVLRMKNDFFHK